MKKFLAILLAVVMILGMLPMTVSAESSVTVGTPITADSSAWGTQNNNGWYFMYKLATGSYHEMPFWADPWTSGTGFASNLTDTVEMFFITQNTVFYGENNTRPVLAYQAPESGTVMLRMQTHSTEQMHMQVYVGSRQISINGADNLTLCTTGTLTGGMTLTQIPLSVKQGEFIYVEFYSTDISVQRQAWINEYSITYLDLGDNEESIVGTTYAPDLTEPAWTTQNNNNWYYMYKLASDGSYHEMPHWEDPWTAGAGFASNLSDTVEMFFITTNTLFYGENNTRPVLAFKAPESGNITLTTLTHSTSEMHMQVYVGNRLIQINGEDSLTLCTTGALAGGMTETAVSMDVRKNDMVYVEFYSTDTSVQRQVWCNGYSVTYNSVTEDAVGDTYEPDSFGSQPDNNWFYRYKKDGIYTPLDYFNSEASISWQQDAYSLDPNTIGEMVFINSGNCFFLGENGGRPAYSFLVPTDGYLKITFETHGLEAIFATANIDGTALTIDGADSVTFNTTGTDAGFTEHTILVHAKRNQIVNIDCDSSDMDTSRQGWLKNLKVEYLECDHSATTVYGAVAVGCTTDGCTGDTICDYCGETITASVVIPATGHNYVDGYCTVCGAAEPMPEIKYAYLTLNENIDVTCAAEIPEDFSNPYMVFTMKGISRTVTDYTVADGKYCFTFTGVTPQYMGEDINIVLHASRDGVDYTDTVESYSIRDYCEHKLSDSDTKLTTLLSDLLTYGAAAQTYSGYNTDALVNADLALTPSTFSEISGKTVSFSGTASASADWKAATLVLNNATAIRLYFTAASTEGLTVSATLDGTTRSFDADDFVAASEGKYYVEFTGIAASQYDETLTASFALNGEAIGRTISYSVNAYLCGTQNVANANLKALVRAMYNYGVSAAAYLAGDEPAEEEPAQNLTVESTDRDASGWSTLIF